MKVGYRRVSTVEQKFDRQELGENVLFNLSQDLYDNTETY